MPQDPRVIVEELLQVINLANDTLMGVRNDLGFADSPDTRALATSRILTIALCRSGRPIRTPLLEVSYQFPPFPKPAEPSPPEFPAAAYRGGYL